MTENIFKIDIETTKNSHEETPFAGLIPFMQMCGAMKLPEIIDQALHVRDK
ncbi:MAG: hypothetical protein LBQ42_11910 [Synergistaceae bacterium]|jgi:hypothetical protein|nr:hypothetical protein [Synergistaceae bacterium]